MRWRVSNRSDPIGARMADRHYSRQKPGTPQFVGSGSDVVLIAPPDGNAKALWVTKWQKYVRTPWWKDAWVCSLFRNEGAGLSSELVTEAVQATMAVWGGPPPGGFVTFVDSDKTKPKAHPGYCYRVAGWEHVGHTGQGLYVLRLAPDDFPEPVEPFHFQRSLVPPDRTWVNKLSDNLKGQHGHARRWLR